MLRLLTLTGPGGSGKTRLALELGSGLVDGFRDGVVFVELGPVTGAELVPATIAHALGLGADVHTWDGLIGHLRRAAGRNGRSGTQRTDMTPASPG